MCIDESNENNAINCVDRKYCNKLITYYQITDSNKGGETECLNKDSDELAAILSAGKHSGVNGVSKYLRGSTLVPEMDNIDDYLLPSDLVEFYKPSVDLHVLLGIILVALAVVLVVTAIYVGCVFCSTYKRGKFVLR